MTGPPDALVTSIVGGPSLVTDLRWFDRCDSTNAEALRAASDGAAEGLLVVADEQTAGRGRHGRTWVAPPGSSLLWSLLLRPAVPAPQRRLLPLLTGLVVAEVVARHVPEAAVSVKWPNDVLVDQAKVAGILAEATGDAVVVGVGVNVDWRGVPRPDELGNATSVAEAAGRDIDRWRLLAGLVGMVSQRYEHWRDTPAGFLDDYRRRCSTIGARVAVTGLDGAVMQGEAAHIDDEGALVLRTAGGVATVTAGDVQHIRGEG